MSFVSRLLGRQPAHDPSADVTGIPVVPVVAVESPTSDQGAEKVLAAMSRARQDVVERVRDVNALTEKKVMSAAQNISASLVCASDQMRDLRGVLERFDGAGAGGVAQAIDGQATTVERHVAEMLEQAKAQVAAATSAQAQAAQMHKASLAIEVMAKESRILALNARVEASRLGRDNQTFAVVADEMRRLSQAVASANTMVRELAERLGTVLTTVTEQARATCDGMEAFSKAAQTDISVVRREVRAFQEVVHTVVSASDQSIAFIVKSSQEAMSHLQFQDVVAQGLLRIDARIHDLQIETAHAMGEPERIDALAPAVHREVGGDKDVVNTTAGEVMLL